MDNVRHWRRSGRGRENEDGNEELRGPNPLAPLQRINMSSAEEHEILRNLRAAMQKDTVQRENTSERAGNRRETVKRVEMDQEESMGTWTDAVSLAVSNGQHVQPGQRGHVERDGTEPSPHRVWHRTWRYRVQGFMAGAAAVVLVAGLTWMVVGPQNLGLTSRVNRGSSSHVGVSTQNLEGKAQTASNVPNTTQPGGLQVDNPQSVAVKGVLNSFWRDLEAGNATRAETFIDVVGVGGADKRQLLSYYANQLKDLKVTAYKIQSLTPMGADAVKAVVHVTIKNVSTSASEMDEIDETVRKVQGQWKIYVDFASKTPITGNILKPIS